MSSGSPSFQVTRRSSLLFSRFPLFSPQHSDPDLRATLGVSR